METLGDRVKRLRGERKMTAAQLAHKAGVGENAIFKIESGTTKEPSFAVGARIASALGISALELAGEREPRAAGEERTGLAERYDDVFNDSESLPTLLAALAPPPDEAPPGAALDARLDHLFRYAAVHQKAIENLHLATGVVGADPDSLRQQLIRAHDRITALSSRIASLEGGQRRPSSPNGSS